MAHCSPAHGPLLTCSWPTAHPPADCHTHGRYDDDEDDAMMDDAQDDNDDGLGGGLGVSSQFSESQGQRPQHNYVSRPKRRAL